MNSYRTLWISDVHLGTKDCKAKQLNSFLKQHSSDELYLVGDIIDGWRMRSGVYWKREFTKVIRQLLKLSKRGTEIHYVTGNHDEFLRRFANHSLDNIHLHNRFVHTTADGRRLLVIHGDQYDGVVRAHKLLKFLGDKGYDLLMFLNRRFNFLREGYGYGYWSLAGYLKSHIKRAQTYIEDYEQSVAYSAKKQGFDGVVCGHIHHPASKRIKGVDYYNTGDWVESCSALVEHHDGRIELIHWLKPEAESESESETDDELEGYMMPKILASTLASHAINGHSLGPALERLDEVDDQELGEELPNIPVLILPGFISDLSRL